MSWIGGWLGNWLSGWLGRAAEAIAAPDDSGYCAVRVVRYLLAHDAALLALVAADNIAAGSLPLDTVLPAICVQEISLVQRRTASMTAGKVLATSRVQVTVIATSVSQQKAILDLVRSACPNTRGIVNTVSVDSILPDQDGPDMRDQDATIFAQSKDFIVRFALPA